MTCATDVAPAKQHAHAARVLVVDDHASARESMGDILRHAGHVVDCCETPHSPAHRMPGAFTSIPFSAILSAS